ncbi:MAG: aminotransferase class IV [Cyclobacteriaceae bacterium]|nr:aminotransferase class IV [Cyclobacteriaceae bacterium]
MSQLLESIYLKDGEFRNLLYHEARMQLSTKAVFNSNQKVDLSALENEAFPSTGLYKVRIVYDTQIRNMEFVPYEVRPVTSLKLVYDNDIHYHHKFLDRTKLEHLYSLRGKADDILIVKNGLITDSFYANVIFKKGGNWFTPASYLINGTMRKSLLDQQVIKEAVITHENYNHYQSCKLINSMLGMDGPEISIESIF